MPLSYSTPKDLSLSDLAARETVVHIDGLSKWYGNFQVLHGIDLSVKKVSALCCAGLRALANQPSFVVLATWKWPKKALSAR